MLISPSILARRQGIRACTSSIILLRNADESNYCQADWTTLTLGVRGEVSGIIWCLSKKKTGTLFQRSAVKFIPRTLDPHDETVPYADKPSHPYTDHLPYPLLPPRSQVLADGSCACSYPRQHPLWVLPYKGLAIQFLLTQHPRAVMFAPRGVEATSTREDTVKIITNKIAFYLSRVINNRRMSLDIYPCGKRT